MSPKVVVPEPVDDRRRYRVPAAPEQQRERAVPAGGARQRSDLSQNQRQVVTALRAWHRLGRARLCPRPAPADSPP